MGLLWMGNYFWNDWLNERWTLQLFWVTTFEMIGWMKMDLTIILSNYFWNDWLDEDGPYNYFEEIL
jgi:hypothetical protein